MKPRAGSTSRQPDHLNMVNNDHISELFLAATEAVEEAISSALLAAETTEGNGHAAPGLDAESLLKALDQAGWPDQRNSRS